MLICLSSGDLDIDKGSTDSTAQFLDWFKRPFPGQGIFEYYRQLAEQAERLRGVQPIRPQWAVASMEWLAEQSRTS